MDLTEAIGAASEDHAIHQFVRVAPGVPIAVGEWDSGILIDVNQAMADLLGAPVGSLVGRSILDFHVEPDRRALFLRAIETAGGSAETDVELRRADGRKIWVRMSARRISYRGAPAIITIGHDITAHRERERQLANVQDRLARQTTDLTANELRIKQRAAEAANRAKSVFLASMSHELRSPLNSILGFSEMVRDLHFGRDQVEKYIEYGGYIHQAGTHLLALIDDILDLAKVEAGKLKLQPSRFDLSELLDECARMMRPMAERGGLTFQVAPSPAIALSADRLRTKQMIINLLSNAIKFTPAGGKIELAAHRAPDQSTVVAVIDTGVGMSEKQLSVALQPFGRIETSAVTDPTGTGLGLPIVKNLIEAHGGSLQVLSEPSRGTIARLIFPAQPLNP